MSNKDKIKKPAAQAGPAQRAMELKSAVRLPDHPLPRPTADPSMNSTPQEGQAPSGALDAEGHRPVVERSRKVR